MPTWLSFAKHTKTANFSAGPFTDEAKQSRLESTTVGPNCKSRVLGADSIADRVGWQSHGSRRRAPMTGSACPPFNAKWLLIFGWWARGAYERLCPT